MHTHGAFDISKDCCFLIDSILNLLQKEVNKLSVSYSSKPFPKCKDAEKLFDGGTKCVLTLVSSIYHLPLQQGLSSLYFDCIIYCFCPITSLLRNFCQHWIFKLVNFIG